MAAGVGGTETSVYIKFSSTVCLLHFSHDLGAADSQLDVSVTMWILDMGAQGQLEKHNISLPTDCTGPVIIQVSLDHRGKIHLWEIRPCTCLSSS